VPKNLQKLHSFVEIEAWSSLLLNTSAVEVPTTPPSKQGGVLFPPLSTPGHLSSSCKFDVWHQNWHV